MKIFYNFDNMYDRKNIVTNNTKNIDDNKAYATENNVILDYNTKNAVVEKSDNKYELDNDVALFDYSAKTTSRYLNKQGCTNVDCFEGLNNQELPCNCMDYTNCLQYFNTMPLMNCLDNVPTASFLILD